MRQVAGALWEKLSSSSQSERNADPAPQNASMDGTSLGAIESLRSIILRDLYYVFSLDASTPASQRQEIVSWTNSLAPPHVRLRHSMQIFASHAYAQQKEGANEGSIYFPHMHLCPVHLPLRELMDHHQEVLRPSTLNNLHKWYEIMYKPRSAPRLSSIRVQQVECVAVLSHSDSNNHFNFIPLNKSRPKKATSGLCGSEAPRVWSIAWHPSSAAECLLATASSDACVRFWSSSSNGSWCCVGTLPSHHQRTVRCVEWCPTTAAGDRLACCCFDGTVTVWRRKWKANAVGGKYCDVGYQMQLESVLEGHVNEVKRISWWVDYCAGLKSAARPHRCLLSSCSRDKSVWVWERESPLDLERHVQDEDQGSRHDADAEMDDDDEASSDEDDENIVEFECGAVLNGHSQDVKCVTWHVDGGGHCIVSSGYDDTVKVWMESDDCCRYRFNQHLQLTSEPGLGKDEWHCKWTLLTGAATVWECRLQLWVWSGCNADSDIERESLRLLAPTAGGTAGASSALPLPRLLLLGTQAGQIQLWQYAVDPVFITTSDANDSATSSEQHVRIFPEDGYRWQKVGQESATHEGYPVYGVDWLHPIPASTTSLSSSEPHLTANPSTLFVTAAGNDTFSVFSVEQSSVNGTDRVPPADDEDDENDPVMRDLKNRQQEQDTDRKSHVSSSPVPKVDIRLLHQQVQAHIGDLNCVKAWPGGWSQKGDEFTTLVATAGDDGVVKIWKLTTHRIKA